MANLAQHSSETNEAYTPRIIVAPSKQVLGRIDWDPASSAVANQEVQAERFGTIEHSGWKERWVGNTFLNPPGGLFNIRKMQQVGTKDKKGHSHGDLVSSAAAWWSRLVWEYTFGAVTSAIFVCFSMSILRNVQSTKLNWPGADAIAHPLDFPTCIPKDRIAYDKITQKGERVPTSSPPADSMIVYLPPKDLNRLEIRSLFSGSFEHLGRISFGDWT